MFGKSFRYATVFSVDQPSILPFPRVAVQKQEPVDSAAMATARVLPCPKAAGRHMESDCFFRLQIGTAYQRRIECTPGCISKLSADASR
ncbi:hypothetical protein [Caballeronia glathei]|uniref:Uncharacterized protein n=1 Tax=Caballeronia glathei TaxID=60547 RepID=A0A069Q290_9BURK|nr:hypothetical protein [Caballeronia glathei]KDR43906.1 hypothetical protein BG61_29315 [Caballeronia glathei]